MLCEYQWLKITKNLFWEHIFVNRQIKNDKAVKSFATFYPVKINHELLSPYFKKMLNPRFRFGSWKSSNGKLKVGLKLTLLAMKKS